MPKHITVSTIKYFNDQKLKFLFCTNTIIEGVNTSAKNVIYYDSKIGTRDVDYLIMPIFEDEPDVWWNTASVE